MVEWYRGDTLDAMYWFIYDDIVKKGTVRETRETKSYEMRNVSIEQVQNPHLFSLPLLHNKCLSYGELMLILAGNNDLSSYSFYSLAFKQWAEGGKMAGAYGSRFNLLEICRIVNRLKRDCQTRRAVIAIYDNEQDINVTGQMLDVACNLAIHFVPEGNFLDLNVFARSTDFRKGFIYDMGIWSLLLYFVSGVTSFDPGTLTFFTSSLHVYERDVKYLDGHNGACSDVTQQDARAVIAPDVSDIEWLIKNERNVRENSSLLLGDNTGYCALPLYLLLPMIQLARNHKNAKFIEPYVGGQLWEMNKEYYEYAAGSLLEG